MINPVYLTKIRRAWLGGPRMAWGGVWVEGGARWNSAGRGVSGGGRWNTCQGGMCLIAYHLMGRACPDGVRFFFYGAGTAAGWRMIPPFSCHSLSELHKKGRRFAHEYIGEKPGRVREAGVGSAGEGSACMGHAICSECGCMSEYLRQKCLAQLIFILRHTQLHITEH